MARVSQQEDVRGRCLTQEISACVWLLSAALVKRAIADNVGSDEQNDQFY